MKEKERKGKRKRKRKRRKERYFLQCGLKYDAFLIFHVLLVLMWSVEVASSPPARHRRNGSNQLRYRAEAGMDWREQKFRHI